MCIRQAGIEDADQIRAVILKAGETGRCDFDEPAWSNFVNYADLALIGERLKDKKYFTLCYIFRDRVVGILTLKDLAKVDQLFVDPEMQRQGVASKLWEAAKSHSLKNGDIDKFSVKSSTQAIPFYQRIGFKVVGGREIRDGVIFTPMELVL